MSEARAPEPAPRTAAATREAIASAARTLFHGAGYAGTSVRGVASAVGVDPALVIRYFGSKEALFLETMALAGPYGNLTDGPLEGLGARMVEKILTVDQHVTFTTYRVMLRASDSDLVREAMTTAMEAMLHEPLAPRLRGDDVDLRVRLIAAQVMGLLDVISILAYGQVSEAPVARVVALYGPAIQLLVEGEA